MSSLNFSYVTSRQFCYRGTVEMKGPILNLAGLFRDAGLCTQVILRERFMPLGLSKEVK